MIALNDLKTYLKITDNVLDSFLQECIEYTIEKMSAYCRRDLRYGAKYDVISGNLNEEINLKVYPVDSVSYIRYRDESTMPPGGGHNQFNIDLFSGEPVEDNIYLDNENGDILLLKGFKLPRGMSNVEIKYYAGYTVSAPNPVCETPKDLKSVCLTASAEFFLKSSQGDSRLGIKSRSDNFEDGTKKQRVFIDEDYSIILNRYKESRI
jgi:hypothetical protein